MGRSQYSYMGKLPQTPAAKRVISYAIEEAGNLKHKCVGTEHILLGLLIEDVGVAAQVLMNRGLRLDGVRAEIEKVLAQQRIGDGRNTPPCRLCSRSKNETRLWKYRQPVRNAAIRTSFVCCGIAFPCRTRIWKTSRQERQFSARCLRCRDRHGFACIVLPEQYVNAQ